MRTPRRRINVSANLVSSSLLGGSRELNAAAPGATYQSEEVVPVRRLDEAGAPHILEVVDRF